VPATFLDRDIGVNAVLVEQVDALHASRRSESSTVDRMCSEVAVRPG
jgi:hypothetical protein